MDDLTQIFISGPKPLGLTMNKQFIRQTNLSLVYRQITRRRLGAIH